MAIVRWNPWDMSSFLNDDWDVPTVPFLSRLGQGLNLYETEDAIVAEAAVPGITEDNIDVTVDDGIVRITASAKSEQKEKDKRKSYMSTMNTSYNYSFRLPQGMVGEEEPICELSDGVLTVRFPKAAKTPPKKLKVNKISKAINKEKK